MRGLPCRLAGPALFAVALVMAACSSEEQATRALGVTVRDSAGVTVVDNAAPEPASRMSWTVGSTPLLSIGTLDGEAPYELFEVADAMRLSDGRILIANGGTSEIRVFDSVGVWLETWGQAGEGPGEFLGLTDLMVWPGDSILAWDFGQGRLTLYDHDGTTGRTLVPRMADGVASGSTVGVFGDGVMLVAGSVTWAGQDPVQGLVRRSRDYALTDPTGEPMVALGPFPDEEYVIKGARLALIRHPFRRLIHTAIWNEYAVITPSDRYEIRAYGTDGTLRRIARRDHAPAALTRARLDAWYATRIDEADPDERSVLSDLFRDLPLLPTLPAFSQIVADATGNLWVKEYAAPGDLRSVWTVFDPEGRVRGLVETPPGLLIDEIGADYLLGRATDAFGVETVQLWSLARRAPAASPT